MTSNGQDEFGRDPHLRALWQERQRRSSQRTSSEAGSATGRSARSNSSRGGSRVSVAGSGGGESADELAGSGRAGRHSGAEGATRCSGSNSGDQPSESRSPKGSLPIGVPPGARGEGVGARRRGSDDRSPRTVLKRFASSSGSCCFDAISFGWRSCNLGAEFDVPVVSINKNVTTGEVEETREGERFCLAHTCIVVFAEKIKALLSVEEMRKFEDE